MAKLCLRKLTKTFGCPTGYFIHAIAAHIDTVEHHDDGYVIEVGSVDDDLHAHS